MTNNHGSAIEREIA